MNKKIYQFIGLCMKAGCLMSGNEQIADKLKKGKGELLIITEDSSMNTKNEYISSANKAGISYIIFGEKEQMGNALGKSIRTAVLIMDKGFAEALRKKLNDL